jgi:hypothetical protein
MKVTNDKTKETIDIAPNWENALLILGVVCQDGNDKGKKDALAELQRLGRELDNAKLKR